MFLLDFQYANFNLRGAVKSAVRKLKNGKLIRVKSYQKSYKFPYAEEVVTNSNTINRELGIWRQYENDWKRIRKRPSNPDLDAKLYRISDLSGIALNEGKNTIGIRSKASKRMQSIASYHYEKQPGIPKMDLVVSTLSVSPGAAIANRKGTGSRMIQTLAAKNPSGLVLHPLPKTSGFYTKMGFKPQVDGSMRLG